MDGIRAILRSVFFYGYTTPPHTLLPVREAKKNGRGRERGAKGGGRELLLRGRVGAEPTLSLNRRFP